MTTLELLMRHNGIWENVRSITSNLDGISQCLTNAGNELRKAQADLYLWKQMAETLVKHVPGVSDQDCKVIAAYESLKEKTK